VTEPALVPLARVVATALGEDLGDPPTVGADVTASATVAEHIWARGAFVPRQDGVVAGLAAIAETYAQLDDRVSVRLAVADGDRVRPGEPVAAVEGPAPAVLAGERTALNLLTHLSGVATATRQVVDAIGDHRCVVRDTRKTLPGLRALQKAAVVAGGGVNHRLALVDGLLVKDNHVAAAGGFAQAVRAALAAAAGLAVQIEVDSLAQLDVALAEGVDAVLLDNFTVDDTAEAVRRCRAVRRAVFVESSGALTLDTVEAYAAAGVDAVSLGGLTHSAPALDIGLDVDLDPAGERS
jgi:nicotinate-nucleotide pyrophosphorylase (carboxylating)